MSQEGANLPQEVEGSHDQATAPHASIPVGVGSPTATVMLADAGTSHHAISAVLSTGEGSDGVSEITSPVVPQAGEDDITNTKIASPAVLLASEENKAKFKQSSPAVLLADEEKSNNAIGSKLASPVMLPDCDNSKDGSHAGVDNNAADSKLARQLELHVCDGNNTRSKITSSAMPHTIMDNTPSSKLDSAVLHAGEDKNIGFTLHNSTVLHGNMDKDNNIELPKFTSPLLFHAGKDHEARTKPAIRVVSHAGGNTGSSRLTSGSMVLLDTKDNASNLPTKFVSRLDASKDNNAGSSKAATRPAAVNASESNTEGKNNDDGEERAHKADVGSGSGKGNAPLVLDVDHNLHIFTERERRKKMKNMFSTLHALLPQLPNKADKATIVGEAVIYIKTLERTAEKLEKLKLERKHALAAQQQVVGAGSSRASSSMRHSTAAPAPLASSLREENLADMVHGWQVQQAAVAVANKALATPVATAVAMAGSSSSSAPTLPRGAVPFPAPAGGFQTWSGKNLVVSMANNEAYINLHTARQRCTLTKALFVLERHHIEIVTTTISTQDGFRMYGIHARVNPALPSARFPENLCAEDRFKLAVSEMVQLLNI